MNIGIFTNNYLPNPYGVTGSVESFRKQFERKGHNVYIFAPQWKGYKDENPNACPPLAAPSGVSGRVFRYPSVDIKFKFRFPLAVPYSRKMDKIISDLNLDIIHSQHPALMGTSAMKWAKKKNIPLVFTWHTLYDQYTNFVPLIPDKLTAKWIIRKAAKYANACDQIIIPTESLKNIIKNWGVVNENIKAIPTGIEEEIYKNPDRSLVRNKYGINEDETLLLSISRLTKEKNVRFLLRAVSEILKSKSKVKFLIAGEGYLVPELKKIVRRNSIEDKVIFAGIVNKKEIKDYYAAGDIFVYASKSETQGMIISEAMYSGLPIVAVRATGIQDLVEDRVNGYLVFEDKKDLINATNKLIDDIELRKKFSEESSRIAREKYTSTVCANKMLEVYFKLLKSS